MKNKKSISMLLLIAIMPFVSSCEKTYKKIGGGILSEFTGEYILSNVEVRGLQNPVTDTTLLNVNPRNAQLLSLYFQRWDGTTMEISTRRSEYTLYKNDSGNNTIKAYFPDKEQYMYIEDLSGNKKERLVISDLVDEINSEADSVRYFYRSTN
jgi:hypothetical protein